MINDTMGLTYSTDRKYHINV